MHTLFLLRLYNARIAAWDKLQTCSVPDKAKCREEWERLYDEWEVSATWSDYFYGD